MTPIELAKIEVLEYLVANQGNYLTRQQAFDFIESLKSKYSSDEALRADIIHQDYCELLPGKSINDGSIKIKPAGLELLKRLNEQRHQERLDGNVKALTVEQIETTIYTNKSIQLLNEETKKVYRKTEIFTYVNIVIAFLTGLFIALQFFKDDATDLRLKYTQLEQKKELQDSLQQILKDEIKNLQIRTDSIVKVATDKLARPK